MTSRCRIRIRQRAASFSGFRLALAIAVALLASIAGPSAQANAVAIDGRVTFQGSPVPGATVTAEQGETRHVTTSDENGDIRLGLPPGLWTLRIEMQGFTPIVREVSVTAPVSINFEMTLVPPDFVFTNRSTNEASARAIPAANGAAPDATPVTGSSAADGLVVNGSVYNAAASPFAQSPAFGNNRPGSRSLFNGSLAFMGGSSSWDARPYAFTNQRTASPDYGDLQFAGTFAGPIKVPFVSGQTLVNISYQRSVATTANSVTSRVPTLDERLGDFSASRDSKGVPISLVDPATGLPFVDSAIPATRLSPQALALLAFYPEPNRDDSAATNFETTTTDRAGRDTLQVRANRSLTVKQALTASVSYQRANTRSTSLFAFEDRTQTSDTNVTVGWTYRASPTKSFRARYEFIGIGTSTQPFFASRVDVSGDAGIGGNDRAPVSWGPPNLNFSSGLAGLSSTAPTSQQSGTHVVAGEATWLRGHHAFTFGADFRPRRVTSASRQDPRGTFTFTGDATGDAFADFLLGLPHASAISFGEEQQFRGRSTNAFIVDDWGLLPGLTLNLGVRWEYEAPFEERSGQLANLDLAADFSSAGVVTPAIGVGPVTGHRYPASLVDSDRGGFQPRVALAWRPLAASSLLVRAGYGIYRQPNTYLPIAIWLARQPPFSTAASLETSGGRTLTLANGFATVPDSVTNTMAVDPRLRAGFAENWQASVQRDLPGSLTVNSTYLGIRGHRLLQESLPNTVAAGAVNSCVTCPIGFIYVTSNGSSSRHAIQFQIRRRLRNGFTANAVYSLAKATDNAAALGGVTTSGSVIAQDWRDLDAEWGPSAFDQRHLVTVDAEYTSGVGTRGGALMNGLKGRLLKGWVLASQLSIGSGLPLTPRYLTSVPGTGVTGSLRASVADVAGDTPAGLFLNPAAYRAPAPGEWGTAGRNSARGPAQFSLNASVGRSFTVTERQTLDWRIDATNALNRVTYVSVATLVGSPQFGLPDRAGSMRKLRMTLRWRF